ncbi:MAG: M48 family metallopeptidase [Candidatus Doudnabacteria bacterium]|nr:M48 family metallopeptidase [Candidatus Doudnabacteria bacterium]
MEKEIELQNQKVSYKLYKSIKARRVSISVSCETGLVVTLPYFAQESVFENFLRLKASWVLKKLKYFEKVKLAPSLRVTAGEFLLKKETAKKYAEEKVRKWNAFYGFGYNRISIKNQKTRWGSCSRKGNLSFHYKILDLPEELADYLVVHELCHLKELNHGSNFWQLVFKTQPNYKKLRKSLLEIRIIR